MFVSTKSPTVPVIAWNWVIQSLAKFKQLDSSTLVALVKKAPAISDDLGRDAREMISLRILESLFIHGSEATVDTDSAQSAKISFNPSEHCEDVLHKILEETSEPMTRLDRQKWNVRPFIMHKRASLPKSFFQKFKEALLEGSHPRLSSLKERSKVGAANVPGNTSSVADANFDAQTTVAKDDLVSLNSADEHNKLQESLLQKSNEVENFTRGITEHIGREHEMSIESPVKDLEENTLMDHVEHTVSKKLEQNCGNANTEHGQQQPPGDDDNVPQDVYREGQEKRVPIDSMKVLELVGEFRDCMNDILPNDFNSGPSREGKKYMENGGQLETGSDSERSDDEWTDIAAKKEAFLSSQCTLSQDFMAMNDCTEICLCMKCNKGGQLLVCSSDACPFRVHESCLGSTATLDENGKYFCPFCAYSHAISKYLKVKKKVSLARKDLQAFLSLGVKCRPKTSTTKGAGLGKNESRKIGALGEKFVVNGNGDAVSRGKEDCAPTEPSCGEERVCVSNAENPVLAEPSRSRVNNELHCGDKGVYVGNGSSTEACQSLTRMEGHQPSLKAACDCIPNSVSSKGNGREHRIGEHANIHLNNGCLNQPVCQPSMPKQQYNEKESPASVESSHSRRSCKRKPQYTSPPAVPLLGRKKLKWTKSEEEILKEGVQRFSNVNSKKIPWREILNFGRHVFHKSRTTIDLKDKWRNICGSRVAKKPKL